MITGYPKVNYIGNKEKIAEWIINELPLKSGKVLDIFAGGCSVSYALKRAGYSVISNDILYVDYVLAKALIENSQETLSINVLSETVDPNRVQELEKNFQFLTDTLYYQEEVMELSKLVAISENLKGYDRYIMLSLIRRAMIRKLPYSRMNVPWQQIQKLRDEEYSYKKYKRRRAYHNKSFEFHIRENIDKYNNAVFKGADCKAYNYDVFELLKHIDKVDIVYMDPPYPSTMNNYHDFYGKFDEMFDKKKAHIDYTKKNTFLENLDRLIDALIDKTKYIMLSQNTKVKPEPELIEAILRKYGKVDVRRKDHNYQVTGKDNKNSSQEILFILEINSISC